MISRAPFCGLLLVAQVACAAPDDGAEPDPEPITVVDDSFDAWDTSAWRSGQWCGNNYDGDLVPSTSAGALILAEGDFCWGQIMSRATVSDATIAVIPHLESGGVNGDALFVALAYDWVQYGSDSVAGLRFADGSITAISDGSDAGSMGSYTPGQSIRVELTTTGITDLSIRVLGQERTISTSFAFDAEPNIVIAVKDSDDGADVDRVSGASWEAAP